MPKLKQSTLFSFNSWNKVTLIPSIRKAKCALEIPNQNVAVILKTLNSLKDMKLSKNTMVEHGLDATLQKLLTHPSVFVTTAVRNSEVALKLELVPKPEQRVQNQLSFHQEKVKPVVAEQTVVQNPFAKKQEQKPFPVKQEQKPLTVKQEQKPLTVKQEQTPKVEKLVEQASATVQKSKANNLSDLFIAEKKSPNGCKSEKENAPKKPRLIKLKKNEWDVLASEIGLQEVQFYVSSYCKV